MAGRLPDEREYPAPMGYFDDLSPERTWTPRVCTLCWEPSRPLALMFPVKSVHFWRVTDEEGTKQKLRHESQQWFACDRCKEYVVEHRWDELAADHHPGRADPYRATGVRHLGQLRLEDAAVRTGAALDRPGRGEREDGVAH